MSQMDLTARAFAPASPDVDTDFEADLRRLVAELEAVAPTPQRGREPRRGHRTEHPARPLAPASARPALRPTEAEIRDRAQQIFIARGCVEGNPVVDWLEAEAQLLDEYARRALR